MKVFLFTLFVCFYIGANAQFFAKSPHFQPRSLQQQKSLMAAAKSLGISAAKLLDSTYWALRPIVTIATAYPSGKVMGGTGLSIQNNTYTYPVAATETTPEKEGSTYCNYSFNLLALAGGTLIPEKPADIISEAIMIMFLNNHAGAGVSHTRYKVDPTDPDTKKKSRFELIVSYSINFNN